MTDYRLGIGMLTVRQEVDSLELKKTSLVSIIEDRKIELKLTKDNLKHWRDTSDVLISINEELNSAYSSIESKNFEIKNNNQNLIRLLVIAIVFLILFLYSTVRFLKQKREAEAQSIISNSLQMSISQFAHLGKDTVGNVAEKISQNHLLQDSVYNPLIKLRNFMAIIYANSRRRVVSHEINDELDMSLINIHSNFYEKYGSHRRKDIFTIDKEIEKLNVPIYSILNIISNTFKHSLESNDIKIEISQVKKNKRYTRIKIQDFAEKKTRIENKKGTGEKYIEEMINLFNGKKIPVKFESNLNKMGYFVEFNIRNQ